MNLALMLLSLTGFFYFAAFTVHLISFFGTERHRPAFALMRVGFLVGTVYFAAEAIDHGYFLPVLNFTQALAFFAWSLAFVYLVLMARPGAESFGLVLSPLLFLLTAAACMARLQEAGLQEPPRPVLLNPYFTVHIASAFFAYASFTLSFAAGILYLIQSHELKSRNAGRFYHKLPSLEELEQLIYQPLFWGAPLLLAAMGVGFIWAKSAFGEFWILEPKTITTVLTAAMYIVLLVLHARSALRGRQGAVLSVIAFGLVLFTFVGTRFLAGAHNFSQ